MQAFFIGVLVYLFTSLFGDYLKALFLSVLVMVGIILLDDECNALTNTSVIYSQHLKDYLKSVDMPNSSLWYQAKEDYNQLGVHLDHNFDRKTDWFLDKSCKVHSARTGVVGEWAVGRHVWVVVFGKSKKDKVAFDKDSLPKGLDETIVKRCSVSS